MQGPGCSARHQWVPAGLGAVLWCVWEGWQSIRKSCTDGVCSVCCPPRPAGMGIRMGAKRTRLYGLNLSRCLGDKFLKDEDLGLSAQPHVSDVLRVQPHLPGLAIVASDGLWDVTDAATAFSVSAPRPLHPLSAGHKALWPLALVVSPVHPSSQVGMAERRQLYASRILQQLLLTGVPGIGIHGTISRHASHARHAAVRRSRWRRWRTLMARCKRQQSHCWRMRRSGAARTTSA